MFGLTYNPRPNCPAIRLNGFTEPWNGSTIDEIFEIRNGYTPSKANPRFWENGTIPWFRMEDIRKNGGILDDAIQHITEEAVKGGGLFKPYSIILATTATIGEHAILIADSLANQQFTNFSIRKSLITSYYPFFIYYAFFKVDDWCIKNTNSGGLLAVDIPSLKQYKLLAPSIQEQKKIGDFFYNFDELISSKQQEIDKHKTIRHSLFNRMFVN